MKFKNYLFILFGCLTASIGTASFLLPNQLSSGGFSGIATLLYYLFSFNMGKTIIILNIPLFIFAYFKLGRKFVFKSIITTIIFSKFIDIFENYKIIVNDKFLASIYGGILIGIGLAFVFKGEASTGGTDLIGQLVSSYNKKIKIANIMIFFDLIIVILNMIFLRQINIGLYSIIAIYIIEKMIDLIFEGINFSKLVYIISDKSEEVSNAILEVMDRGITELYGKGGFSNQNKMVILCVVKKMDMLKVVELTKKIDKNSFIIIQDAREVYGLGFK